MYDPEGNPHALKEEDLPLLLPNDVDFLPTGESPVARSESFKKLAEENISIMNPKNLPTVLFFSAF